MKVLSNVIICKQPAEKLLVGANFTPWVTSAETLSSPTVTYTPDGDLTVTSVTLSGYIVKFFVEGGTLNAKYRFSISVNSDTGEELEADGILKVTGR